MTAFFLSFLIVFLSSCNDGSQFGRVPFTDGAEGQATSESDGDHFERTEEITAEKPIKEGTRPSEDSGGIPGYSLVCQFTDVETTANTKSTLLYCRIAKAPSGVSADLTTIARTWKWSFAAAETSGVTIDVREIDHPVWHVIYRYAGDDETRLTTVRDTSRSVFEFTDLVSGAENKVSEAANRQPVVPGGNVPPF